MKTKTLLALGLLLALVSLSFNLDPVYPFRAATCSDPLVADMLNLTSQTQWADWVEKLSGAEPVTIGGASYTISTRHTRYMATGAANAKALPFVLEQITNWAGDVSQIERDSYQLSISGTLYTTENLILELPGTGRMATTSVILSAHLDSTSPATSSNAPGAEDNASGSAALLEAARTLRHYRFSRDLRIIWFTGEEQGLKGSLAYVGDHSPNNIYGVVNLDMYGYDSNNDHCFELHVGTMPQSAVVGQCFTQGIDAYDIDLNYDYLTTSAEGYSDHETFWNYNVGAVEVLENYSNQGIAGGCVGADENPYYHTINDRIQYMNLPSGFEITKAGIAAAANLAGPLGPCFSNGNAPQMGNDPFVLSWTAMPGAAKYRIYKSSQGCEGTFTRVAETSSTQWQDAQLPAGQSASYQVEAVAGADSGYCISFLSPCQVLTAPYQVFLPAISNE
ncbi:MAG TPA: M28 family metallopeptidase [Anaerolineaceae bacterium]|nr:M28 family metallopeptidase [Anaerolineaceae bacterium]